MAYEAKYDDKQAEEERMTQNNANNIRNAADVAIATKNPYAAAAGAAVKVADKATGGRSTEALGKTMTRVNNVAPLGRKVQDASNKLNESGISDKVGQAAAMKNGMSSGAGENAGAVADKANTASNATQAGGGQTSSLPSSGAEKTSRRQSTPDTSSSNEEKEKSKGIGSFLIKHIAITAAVSFLPFLIIILFVMAMASLLGLFSEYEDAFGMSQTLGEETGGYVFTPSSEEQNNFYKRINDVKLTFQANGKTVDAMKIVAVYHVLTTNGADLEYKDVTTSVITEWADAMFDGDVYSESVFKNNLINSIIPKYLPGKTLAQREELANDVFGYIERYNDLIGSGSANYSCSSSGSCDYDIKGFAVSGRGNVVSNMQVSDIKVRLMECGSPYGNGSYTTAIDQPLVDFESYVAGVAYAEVGPSAPDEVLKAQMVAARSYALARASLGGTGKKLEQENGQWILQISSCVADQVFCNIDEGCSYMGGGDGQGGIVRSGKVAGAEKTRDALPQDHAIRRAASATQGEVLINSQGYIILTSYKSADQKEWTSLAQSGLNYKQILLQHYSKNNAADIQRASCSNSTNTCVSTGDFSTWKQYGSEWSSIPMGTSGKSVQQIGCLVTSVSMLIAKSGVQTNVNPFNPGTFVEFLNSHGGITSSGNFVWGTATLAAPGFVYKGQISLAAMSREQKLKTIAELVNQKGIYAVAEVKGNTGQHWVAIDSVSGSTIYMMDPSSSSNSMWEQYNWANTSYIAYYKVG